LFSTKRKKGDSALESGSGIADNGTHLNSDEEDDKDDHLDTCEGLGRMNEKQILNNSTGQKRKLEDEATDPISVHNSSPTKKVKRDTQEDTPLVDTTTSTSIEKPRKDEKDPKKNTRLEEDAYHIKKMKRKREIHDPRLKTRVGPEGDPIFYEFFDEPDLCHYDLDPFDFEDGGPGRERLIDSEFYNDFSDDFDDDDLN